MFKAKRGRKPYDKPDFIKDVLLKNSSSLKKEGKLRGPGDEIWSILRSQYNITKTPKALYTCVSCNRWNLKQELGLIEEKKENEYSNHAEEEEIECENQDSDDETPADNDNVLEVNEQELPPKTSFQIHIPKDKWNAMEPEEKMYIRTLQKSSDILKTERRYMVLKRGIWSDIFNSMVWEAIKWPCSWSFKGNYVSITDHAVFWIYVRAKCSCGNKLVISCPNPPTTDPKVNGISLNVKVWGDKNNHIAFKEKVIRKRNFAGEKRRQLGEDMIDKNIKASRIRRLMSSEMMEFRDPYPAHLPSNEVVRQIRSQALQTRRMDNDPLRAIQQLKYSKNPLYMFCIKEIGLDPFFVHLITPDQLKLYNLYCSNNYSRLIVDATGKLVHKLRKPGDLSSSHIFLYIGVVRVPGKGEGLVPVVQMLSERHNANAIHYWLFEWVREGASIPNEVVLDDSAALISATCRALGKESSTAAYITKCFNYMTDNDELPPITLIRLDVAHFTNFIRKWPELGYPMKRKTKEFYIRVIILVAKCELMKDIKALLKSIFIVAFSETEGTSESSGKSTPCQIERRKLLKRIAGLSIEESPEWVEVDYQEQREDAYANGLDKLMEDDFVNMDSLSIWIKKIKAEAIATVLDDGDHDNIMHSPALADKLEKLLHILPLWCNVLPRKMGSPYSSSIGAYVETEIGQLKHNLLKTNSPTRIDDFVMDYLKICDGSIKISATMQSISLKENTLDLQSRAVKKKKVVNHSLAGETSKVKEHKNSESQDELPTSSCPACANGDLPGGAHMCAICDKYVHALDSCSTAVGEEGFGQNRICIACIDRNKPQQSSQTQVVTVENYADREEETAKIAHQLALQTSIVDRQDLTTKLKSSEVEATSVEGWRGLSLPPKKIPTGYYWRHNPDFPMLLSSSCKTPKLGVMKNGMDPTLKIVKIGKISITLSNTCSFDAVCQLFATSYIDSSKYSEILDGFDVTNTILDVAKNIATKGVKSNAYKKRASVLATYSKQDICKGGVTKIDCSMDCSSLLRQMKMIPSVKEVYTCSSIHCPARLTVRHVNLLSAIFDNSVETCMEKLAELLDKGDVAESSPCLVPMHSTCHMSSEAYKIDSALSEEPLCSGIKTRKVEVGPHLIIELVGEERLHNTGGQIGVTEAVRSPLLAVPRTLTYKDVTFHPRGIVGFMPPLRDSDIGHYRGYALRRDGSWEIYDDLRDKVINVDGSVTINVHVLLFAI